MKKIFLTAIALLSVIMVFSACTAEPLPEPFTEEELTSAANRVITVFTNNERQTFFDMCSNDFKAVITNNELDAAIAQIMPAPGELIGVEIKSMSAVKDAAGNDIAAVVAVAEYSEQEVTYTISFDKQMKICGFYIK